jgi:HPt (histidine-containing phosphotransfer) domain-containing protein
MPDSKTSPDFDIPMNNAEKQMYDLTVIKNITKGNKDAFIRMVKVFLDKSTEEMAILKESGKNRNWEDISKIAHKMKPALAYMGMKKLEEEINELHHKSKVNPKEEEIDPLIASIENRLSLVCESLKKEIIQ